MYRSIQILLLFSLLLSACREDRLDNPIEKQLEAAVLEASPDRSLDHFILPATEDYSNIPQDPINPITTEKVALGKMLFFETGLALAPMQNVSKGSYSCGTCHVPEAGMVPGSSQGIADGGIGFGVNGESRTMINTYAENEIDAQGARPISLFNVAFVNNTSWNGQFGSTGANKDTEHLWHNDESTEINELGYSALESQNIEGLKVHRMVVNKSVTDDLGYTNMFDQAFPEFQDSARYSLTTASFAISAYLRTLMTDQAPFQKWLKGNENAMSYEQKKGAVLFFGKARCYQCHAGKSLNNSDFFYAIGVKDLYQTGAFNTDENDRRNMGRGGFTENENDMFCFKVPQLYNLKNAGFYFHGSSKQSLREVVEYFNEGVAENPNILPEQVSSKFQSLDLTEEEMTNLVDFLENGLYDKTIDRYVPEKVLSGNCIPNNDPFSKSDLGCD